MGTMFQARELPVPRKGLKKSMVCPGQCQQDGDGDGMSRSRSGPYYDVVQQGHELQISQASEISRMKPPEQESPCRLKWVTYEALLAIGFLKEVSLACTLESGNLLPCT